MLEDITGQEIKEQFKSNKKLKMATMVIGGIIILAIGYFAYKQFMWNPDNEKSKEKYFTGLNYAAIDSTDIAIEELVPVVKKYDGKIGGEIAQFTLARQYMNKGEFQKALNELDGVNTGDTYITAMTEGLKGDCYSEMENYEKAASTYFKAADVNSNDMMTPEFLFKAGLNAEEVNDFESAVKAYQRIKDDYPNFAQQKTIDKYLARASNKTVK